MKSLTATVLALLTSSFAVAGELTCKPGSQGLVYHEKQTLAAGKLLAKNDQLFLKKVKTPLACMIKIYLEADGFEKVYAHNILRPFLGGPVTKGMPDNELYQQIYTALKRYAMITPSFALALGKSHAAATWDFYRSFCDAGSEIKNFYCAEMLPEAELVKNQGVFESISSILLVKHAYKNLQGHPKAQEKVQVILDDVKKNMDPDNHLLQKALLEEFDLEIKKGRIQTIPLSQRIS